MTSSNRDLNFRLKDGREILIGTNIATNGRDVQRIKILNDIVWEKTKPTTIRLSASPSTVNSGQNFTLTATVVDSTGAGINGNVTFQGSGISGTKTVVAKNGIATLNNISTTNIGINTYTATFPKTDIYLASNVSITVKVNKETPILTKFGDTTVYDTWKIGAKLTKSNGTALSSRTVSCKIDDKTYTATTNAKGIAIFTINTKDTGTGNKTITYTYVANNNTNFNDKDIYNKVTTSPEYKIKDYETKTLSFESANLGSQTQTQQKWKTISGGYQCLEVKQQCSYSSNNRLNTIATSSGVRNKIDWLKVTFKQNSIAKIKKATCKFTAKSLPEACKNSYLGGCFPDPPQVRLNVGSGFKDGKGAKAFALEHYSGNIYYSSHDVISQTVTWNSSYAVTTNPTVAIKYTTGNSTYKSHEEGCIQIKNVSLSVSYIPKQTTSFS